MLMNFDEINFGFETVRWLVVTAVGVYAWFIGRQSASAKELLELRMRITRLEAELQQTPRQAEFHELALKLERLDSSMRALDRHVDSLGATVVRIEEWLLNKGAQK